jgi:hypothetical protein
LVEILSISDFILFDFGIPACRQAGLRHQNDLTMTDIRSGLLRRQNGLAMTAPTTSQNKNNSRKRFIQKVIHFL